VIVTHLVSPAYAASTDLSDVPLAVKTRANPNIIIGLDDSGSMDSEVLLPTNDGALWWNYNYQRFIGFDQQDADVFDPVAQIGPINFNMLGTASSVWKKYVYLFPNGTSGQGARIYPDSSDDHFAVPPLPQYAFTRSPDYNPLYYNPALTYSPWMPSHNGTSLVTYVNAPPDAAPSHAAVADAPTFNLTELQSSDASNFTFRMWKGMRIPAGTLYCKAGSCGGGLKIAATDLVIGVDESEGDYNIPYWPAVYYLKDPTGTDAVAPDGAKLRKYTIAAGSPEMQNFANWFTYYRKRKLLMNAAMGNVFSNVFGLRVGVVRFNNRQNVTMYDFSSASDAANAKRLLNVLYGINGGGGTPTNETLDYIGKQFMRTDVSAPIQYACQYNAAFVVTDGYASTAKPSPPPGNSDGSSPWAAQYGTGLTYPYQDSEQNTIADTAMKYYTENLRLDLPAGRVPVNPFYVGPDADRNSDLHMNTSAMGLGVKGTIYGQGSAAATDPYTTAPDWSSVYPYVARSPKSVDDLWHATLNGRGDMVNATDPAAAQQAIQAIVNNILAKVGAAAAVAVSNANVTSGDRSSFSTSFNAGNWTGDLEAFPIDIKTGLPSLTRSWSARVLLDALADPVNSRRIVTHKGTGTLGPVNNGVAFRAASLSLTQLGLLSTPLGTPSDAAAVIDFLRGDRSKEGNTYRVRGSRLADFVNAEPAFVGPPSQRFIDNGYSAFASSKAGRPKMVYQGGNGGMLHAFNADTGKEEWAYVPNLVMGSLNNLSRKQGFTHLYYVDGTPLAADVDFGNTASGSGSPNWRTILVGGLGKGGRGYYALDITDPIPSGESAAAQKVLWEFPNSSISAADALNVGFTYGRPVIVKTKAKGWVVIVTSGYNNGTDPGGSGGDGQGHIYVLDARNGALIKDIPTGVGTAADPSGLAKMSAFVDASDVDNTIKYLYGGDLKGNLWRVDFTGNGINQWSIAKLVTFVDASGNIQPVTTEPELAEVDDKPLVMVGTGQLFGESDIPGAAFPNPHATQTQTMYGIQDDLSASPVVNPLRSQLVQQVLTVDAATQNRTLTSNGVDYTTQRGWYVDLPGTGERSNTDPALALGVLIFTTNVPDPDPCSPGGKSFFYTIDYKTGGKVSFSGASPFSGLFAGNALASRPTIIKLPNGIVRAIIRLSDSTNIAPGVPVPPSSTTGKRVNWKEILTK
jgi:type IV pilus assembly protein PilY1